MSPWKAINCYRLKDDIKITKHYIKDSERCEVIESRWIHLRGCITCDPIRGFDSSINNNGTKYSKKIYHPIERDAEWMGLEMVNMLMKHVSRSVLTRNCNNGEIKD